MKRVLLFLLLATTANADALFLRAGLGLERSSQTTVRDWSCSQTNPPALFGCNLSARGDLGDPFAWDLGIGRTIAPRTRVELAVTRRELDLDANANFRGVPGAQPVHADARATTAMIIGTVELAKESRFRPFLAAGIGASRNTIDGVHYSFPAIASNAVTITPGGTDTHFAWSLSAGGSIRLSDALFLDLAFRYTDLGDLVTGRRRRHDPPSQSRAHHRHRPHAHERRERRRDAVHPPHAVTCRA